MSSSRSRTSLAPQKITSQNHSQKFPISLSVRCSQSPRSRPGPMCCAALDHSVPKARDQQDTRTSVGPASRSRLQNTRGVSPWWAWHLLVPPALPPMWGMRARDPKRLNVPATKSLKSNRANQEPRKSQQYAPSAKSQRASLCRLFKKSCLRSPMYSRSQWACSVF